MHLRRMSNPDHPDSDPDTDPDPDPDADPDADLVSPDPDADPDAGTSAAPASLRPAAVGQRGRAIHSTNHARPAAAPTAGSGTTAAPSVGRPGQNGAGGHKKSDPEKIRTPVREFLRNLEKAWIREFTTYGA